MVGQGGTMQWPERPTCHGDGEMPFSGKPYAWEQRGSTRHCAYCGSLHPADLLRALDGGARLSGSDWKYGWPHKFYVMAASGGHLGKWYNDHLRDEGYSEAALTLLMAAISGQSGIEFSCNERGELMYRAPHLGYQR